VPSARRSRKQNGVDSATTRLTSNSGNNDNYSTTTTPNDDDDDTYTVLRSDWTVIQMYRTHKLAYLCNGVTIRILAPAGAETMKVIAEV